MLGGGFWLATRAVYFVGIDADAREHGRRSTAACRSSCRSGSSSTAATPGSGVSLQTIPAARRATFTNHKLRSKDDAENLVIQLERGQIDS